MLKTKTAINKKKKKKIVHQDVCELKDRFQRRITCNSNMGGKTSFENALERGERNNNANIGIISPYKKR